MGCFPPAWDQFIPRSDNYFKKSSIYENCHGIGPAGRYFNDSALSPFQGTAVSSPESDCISSSISDAETALNFWDTSTDIMEAIPWDLSLGQPTYGGLPASDLSQDVQTTLGHTRTASYRQRSDPFFPRKKRGDIDAPRNLVGDDKGSNRKLLTASPKSKNGGGKNRSAPQKEDPRITIAQKRARDCHNRVEKQYRNRLNSRYTTLLNMIPITSHTDNEESGSASTGKSVDLRGKGRSDSRGISRGEILDAARQYIQTLEREEGVLQREREQLMRRMKKICPNE